jgi:PKD repeat protein
VKVDLFKGWIHTAPLRTIVSDWSAELNAVTGTLPLDLEPGDDYSWRVTSLDPTGASDWSDGFFSIGAGPTLLVTAPIGGEFWGTGQTHAITWNQKGLTGTDVSITLMKGASGQQTAVRTIAASVPASTGTYSWTIPTDIPAGSDYWIKVASLSVPSLSDLSDMRWSIWMTVSQSPTVTSTVIPTVTQVVLVPGGAGAPGDPNGDGKYDDVNGNGRKDFADVTLYFNQMTWIGANEPVAAFDFNGNGRIDFADVTWLFNNL